MANFSQNNHQQLFVGKTGFAITGTSLATLADGEVACFTPGGTIYSEASADAGDHFMIAIGRADGVSVSKVIDKTKVTKITKKDYAAPTVQLDYIGSNGTSGSIDTNNNTVYRATIELDKGRPETNHGGIYVKDMVYKTDASASQSEIALGLAGSGVSNISREDEKSIRFRALCDNAGAALSATTGTITATNGSKIILAATDMDGEMAVGDFWREGTAVTTDVYKIVSIDTTAQTATLDRPYQGTTQVWGATATEYITAALGAAGNWGVSLTGLTLDFTVGKINDKQASWNLSLDSESFGTTNLVSSTTATPGSGTYRQVAELEDFVKGNNGELYKNESRNSFSYTSMANSAYTYDMIDIEFDEGRSGLIATSNPQVISIAIPTGGTASGWTLSSVTNATPDVIEDLLDGVPAYTTANSFDGSPLTGGDLATD